MGLLNMLGVGSVKTFSSLREALNYATSKGFGVDTKQVEEAISNPYSWKPVIREGQINRESIIYLEVTLEHHLPFSDGRGRNKGVIVRQQIAFGYTNSTLTLFNEFSAVVTSLTQQQMPPSKRLDEKVWPQIFAAQALRISYEGGNEALNSNVFKPELQHLERILAAHVSRGVYTPVQIRGN